MCVITSFFGAVSLKIKYMCRIEETNEGGFTVFIDNKYMIVRRFEEYMDVMISKNTVWMSGTLHCKCSTQMI